MRVGGHGHRVGGRNVDEWRPISRPAHHQRSCQSALGRVWGQVGAFEPPKSPHQRDSVLWIVARPVLSCPVLSCPEPRWAVGSC